VLPPRERRPNKANPSQQHGSKASKKARNSTKTGLGHRAYLTRQRVPSITPECTCGYRAQTLKHVMLFCPERQESRRRLFQAVGSDWKTVTQTKRGLNAATKWMIQESVLDQFSLAREEEEKEGKEGGV
jgi:hypothetical protein